MSSAAYNYSLFFCINMKNMAHFFNKETIESIHFYLGCKLASVSLDKVKDLLHVFDTYYLGCNLYGIKKES